MKSVPNNLKRFKKRKKDIINGEILEIGKGTKIQQLMEDLGRNKKEEKK